MVNPVSLEQILQTIQEMEELPTASAICRAMSQKGLKISHKTIIRRFEANPVLSKAVEDRSIVVIDNAPIGKLFEKVRTSEWIKGTISEHLWDKVRARVDEEILKVISKMDELPIPESISDAMLKNGTGMSSVAISRHLHANTKLTEAIEHRSLQIIDEMPIEKLFEKARKEETSIRSIQISSLERIYSRIDEEIIRTVSEMEELPSMKSVSRALIDKGMKMYWRAVSSRANCNSAIIRAIDDRQNWMIDNVSSKEMFKQVISGKWNTRNLPKPISNKVYVRIDLEILKTIREMKNLPDTMSVSREMEKNGMKIGNMAVSRRFNSNLVLFFARYARHGMSEDQIVSLMMDKKADTPAMQAGLEKRLPHLEVFRESLAVLQFNGMLHGKEPEWILELSSYPAPLYEAGKFMEGKPTAVDSYSIKSTLEQGILYADNVVPAIHISSSLHRIKDSEQMGKLFGEISRVLEDGSRMVFTTPTSYEISTSFDEQVQKAGLVIVEQGLRSTYLPQTEMEPELKPILEKVSGDSKLVVLEKVGPAIQENLLIDPLVKQANGQNGNGSKEKAQAMTLDVPDGINQQLAHLYSKEAAYSDALMLSVLDNKGKLAEVFGYNMNPKQPLTLEHEGAGKALNANEAEKIKILVAQAMKEPGKLGVIPVIRPGKDTTVRADAVKRML